MNADWNTFFRENTIAMEALQIVRGLWVEAEYESEAEAYLERVINYLNDRFDISMEFCDIVRGFAITDPTTYECDIPF